MFAIFYLSSFYAVMIRAYPFVFPAVVLMLNADLPKIKDEGVVRYCCAVSRCAPMTLCICCASC